MRAIKTKFKKATSTPWGKVIVSAILLIVLGGIVGGIMYWQTHKKRIIREKLESAINDKSGGFYSIKYDSLELDEITGFLSVKNLKLTYDSLKYLALAQTNAQPPTLFNIEIPEITVEGVQTPRALIDKEINGRKLVIRNPSIEIIYTRRGKDSTKNVPTLEVYEQILGNLNQIIVDTVLITGAHITTRNAKTNHTGIELNNASVSLFDVRVDSTGNEDDSRMLFSKEIYMAFENLSWFSDNKLYKYIANNVSSNSVDRVVNVGQFLIDPQKGEDAFVKSLPTQDDRFDFSFNNISIKNLDYPQMLNEEFIADSLLIRSASFKIYRDLNIPRDKKNRVGKYPHQALEDIDVPIQVKKVIVAGAFLEYKERNSITKNSGKVQFHNIYATISNLTNKKEVVQSNNIMTADASTSFMNKTPFKVNWKFYLQNPNGRFDVKGTMGRINAEDLNVLTEPMGPARIEDGVINGFSFNLSGNDYSMNGSMQLLYEDLKVAVLEKDKGSKELDKKSLTSFVANILIKNSNPKGNKDPRTVTVTNQRDTNRSIFNVAWKTIFKGIKETVGAPAKK